jgi:hypothetical protein
VWIGYPIFRKTLMAVNQRVINANVLLSTGAWGPFAIGVAHRRGDTIRFGQFRESGRPVDAPAVDICAWGADGPRSDR